MRKISVTGSYRGTKCHTEDCINRAIMRIRIDDEDIRDCMGMDLCPLCYTKLLGDM